MHNKLNTYTYFYSAIQNLAPLYKARILASVDERGSTPMSDLVQEYVDLLYASTIPRVRVQRLSAFIMASCIFWALCW